MAPPKTTIVFFEMRFTVWPKRGGGSVSEVTTWAYFFRTFSFFSIE